MFDAEQHVVAVPTAANRNCWQAKQWVPVHNLADQFSFQYAPISDFDPGVRAIRVPLARVYSFYRLA